MTIDKNRKITGTSKALLKSRKGDFPDKSDAEIKLELLKEVNSNVGSFGK